MDSAPSHLEVRKDKTWGGRFTKELDPVVKKFNSSLHFDYVLYREDIEGSKIHALMLEKQSLISKAEADSIINTLDDIQREIEGGKHILDETYEDIHMFIEQLLIERIGDTGKKLHTGRSRNDQVALDMRLYSRRQASLILKKLEDLINTLKNLSYKHRQNMMPGYTHLQQAQPISLGQYLDAYTSMFKRDLNRLKNCCQTMNYSPLGAGAFAGSKLPLDRLFVAQELGFDGIIESTIDAVSDRDYLIELSSIISICMMHLSRLSEDFIIWSSTEFNFIKLDDSFSTGSSLMPNKKNPDVLELIRGKTGRVFGNLMSILTIMKGLPLAYNKDMQEDKEGFFDSVNTILSSLSVITPFLNSVVFNTDIMRESMQSDLLRATEVLEQLVLQGIPFRDAHHKVGKWILQAIESEKSLKEIAQQEGVNLEW